MRKLLCQVPLALVLGWAVGIPSTGALAEGRYFPQEAIAEWQGEKFTVQRIEFLDEGSLERQNVESWADANRQEIEDLQAALRSNNAFRTALTAQSVQLNNVVAVTRALNGNLVVYLR